MDENLKLVLTTVFSGISFTAIFIWIFKTYLSKKIEASISAKYNEKLENLKGEISKSNLIINTVLSSHSQGFQLGQHERIEAIKTLWQEYISIKELMYPINTYDSAFLEEEFNSIYTGKWKGHPEFGAQFQKSVAEQFNKIIGVDKKIERVRPLINEELWFLFVYIKSFTFRLLYIYNTSTSKKEFRHWKTDLGLLNETEKILTEKELDLILKSNRGSIFAIQNFIEQKMLVEISKIITGQTAAENTYNYALRLSELENKNSQQKS